MKKKLLVVPVMLILLSALFGLVRGSVAHAAGLTLTLPSTYYSNDNATFSISSSVTASSYSLLAAYSPTMNNAFTVANNIAGDRTTYSQTFDSSLGYRYFQLQAYNASGSLLATSNVVGLAKYQSGLMVQMVTDQNLTNSYANYNGTCDGYTTPTWFMVSNSSVQTQGVAPNFLFSEFVHQEPSNHVVVDPYMVQHIQNIRNSWGAINISSGYRTPLHNSQLSGSARCSSHTYGVAVDMTVPDYSTWYALCKVALQERPSYIEPWSLVASAPHVHADWGPQRGSPASCSN